LSSCEDLFRSSLGQCDFPRHCLKHLGRCGGVLCGAIDPRVLPTPPPISDSYGEFMHGAYKLLTLGQEFYREIGPDPIPSSATELRENINETVDASVFDRWRSDETYWPQNLVRWAQRRNIGLDRQIGAVRADDPSTSI